ncbi:hypothetical protein [Bacillus alkalicellulosilyticus]|uniref:hypothetical protein n=1 Tax=Alkalihalobacterium alkalicellulosilyticum TaxID=1912214 RepID=UPI0009964480|nr:hypothetical protein [Bacillus alkalicellulosilyticus]
MKRILFLSLLFVVFILFGCTELENRNQQEEKHLEHVYQAAENYVTFPYHLPYFEDYTIVDMYFVPQDDVYGTEETLFITYNADILVSKDMKQAMDNLKEVKIVESGEGHSIFGPYFNADEILPIHLVMKRSPFDVVSSRKERTELEMLEIEDIQVVFDYTEDAMSGNGSNEYFVFEVENGGTYYRVYVELISKMSEEEVKQKINEMVDAIFSELL